MCVIVDTNSLSPVFCSKDSKHEEFKPILDWVLYGKGKFVIGGSKYKNELIQAKRYIKVFSLLNSLRNKVIKLDDSKVDMIQSKIEKLITDSDFDDPHLPAMVIVSKCKIICSTDARSIPYVTRSDLYPSGVEVPRYYTGIRNRDLLCDAYIDENYKPLNKIGKNTAEITIEKIEKIINKS